MDAALKMKRGRSSNYMMRSEKRPGYGGTPPQKPKRSIWYQVLTILLLIVLCPVGLILLWRKRLRWPGFVKLLATLLSLIMLFLQLGAALWYPFEDERIRSVQQNVSEVIEHTVDVSSEWLGKTVAAGSEFVKKTADEAGKNWSAFWNNKREIGAAAGNHALGMLLDAIASPSPEPSQVPPMTLTQGENSGAVSDLINEPTATPTAEPTATPTTEPTATPTTEPTATPTPEPTATPTAEPTATPTAEPTATPTAEPTATPTTEPTATAEPTAEASANVLERPTPSASVNPTLDPAMSATPVPPVTPTPTPTATPAPTPTAAPTAEPTIDPASIPRMQSAGDMIVWHTSDGKYYHKTSVCGSMSNASQHTLASAIAKGKKACPYCSPVEADWANETEPTVFVSTDNYWHIRIGCESNTEVYEPKLLEEVRSSYKYAPCDACGSRYYLNGVPSFETAVEQTADPEATGAPVTATATPAPQILKAGEVMVWHTSNGKWYHKASKCGSMSNASEYTLSSAVAKGKTACPYCHPIDEDWAETNEEVVFVSAKSEWHIDSNCSANTGEDTVMTLTAARGDASLSACRLCGADHYVNGAADQKTDASVADAVPPAGEDGAAQIEDGLNLSSVVNGDELVYYSANTSHYHRRDRCASSTTTVFQPHTLMEALIEGKINCPVCKPAEPEVK